MRSKATIGQVRDKLKTLRREALESLQIKQMEAVLELMEKYEVAFPRITWGKAKELELEARARGAAAGE